MREICTLRLRRRGLETGIKEAAPVLDPTDEGELEIGPHRYYASSLLSRSPTSAADQTEDIIRYLHSTVLIESVPMTSDFPGATTGVLPFPHIPELHLSACLL